LGGRWNDHKKHLKGNNHSNRKLQNAWNKHGAENFQWNILQECEESKLVWLEAFWMARLNSNTSGYNNQHALQQMDKVNGD
jgi:group I intron endonuclease